MSILSSLMSSLKSLQYNVYEGEVDTIMAIMPKYDEFITVIEDRADFDTEAIFGGQFYEVTYRLIIQCVTKKGHIDDAWARARVLRDHIIDTIRDNRFEDYDVYISSWEKLDNTVLDEPLDAGYQIEVTYVKATA